MNQIGNITFDFSMQNEQFARNLYGRWDHFFLHKFEKIADELLLKYDKQSEIIEIESLSLDLGTFSEEEFDDHFPVVLKEKMEEVLLKYLLSDQKKISIKRSTDSNYCFDLLAYFLLHGSLPWNAANKYKDIRALFLEVLQNESIKLKQFLSTYGHYTSLQQRLVYQLNDPELEKGVNLLSPGSAEFIISYLHLLKAKYKEIEYSDIRESDYRNTVWLVIYAYLLNNRSSYFDKKSFIAQTILDLAGKYNLSYDRMLYLITNELQQYKIALAMSVELFTILLQLQKELSEKQLKMSASSAAKFYKILAELLREKAGGNISGDSREALILILSRVDSCRLFLQQLNEDEIIRLVPIVAPQHADFVIETVKSLEQQKEEGALQGKTGGEFRLLKWQIIFPALFEKQATGFNRKQFIKSIFQKVSAHYNLEISLLLIYFCQDVDTLQWADKSLRSIFKELLEEGIDIKKKLDGAFSRNTEYEEYCINLICKQEKPDLKELQMIFKQLRATDFRRKIIENTTDAERYLLSQWLFPEEGDLIVVYARNLDRWSEQSSLSGKTGSEFSKLKWEFIFSVLSGMPSSNFNRYSFVRQALVRISAHYNLTYFDLLLYFRNDEIALHLPPILSRLLDKLFEEERKREYEMIFKSYREKDRKKFLSFFSLQEQLFIKTYAKTLDQYQTSEIGKGKISGNFRDIKWRFIFAVLFELQQASFNKKYVVRRTLEQIAAHYLLSLSELLEYFYQAISSSKDKIIIEISFIIRELQEVIKKDHLVKLIDLSPNKNNLNNKSMETKQNNQPENFKETQEEMSSTTYVNNAGIMLLSPYLPRLFSMLELTGNGMFKGSKEQIRAIYLIQYLIFGKTDFPEHEMTLNKLLTGFEATEPIPRNIELTEKEIETANSLLKSALQHWEKLKNTSIEGLREGFLQRGGKLEEKEDFFQLVLEERPYDMLLDSLSWNFRTTKFGWMKKAIQTKWR